MCGAAKYTSGSLAWDVLLYVGVKPTTDRLLWIAVVGLAISVICQVIAIVALVIGG